MKKPSRVLSIILIIFITLSVAVIACSCGTSSDTYPNQTDTTGGTTSSADPALASFLADPPKFTEARISGMQSEVWTMPITSYELVGDMYYLHNSSMDLLVDKTNCIFIYYNG